MNSLQLQKIHLLFMVKDLEVVANDFTFSTSEDVQNRKPYGSAKSCQRPPYVPDARFLINLTGTPFKIDESVWPRTLSKKTCSIRIFTCRNYRYGKVWKIQCKTSKQVQRYPV